MKIENKKEQEIKEETKTIIDAREDEMKENEKVENVKMEETMKLDEKKLIENEDETGPQLPV